MSIEVRQGNNITDRFFGDQEIGNIEERGYRLRLAILGPRISPRHPHFEYTREMGMGHLESVLYHRPIGGESIAFMLPERWLSVHEQYYLIHSLNRHPEIVAQSLRSVDIITQSPLILGSAHANEVAVIGFNDAAEGLVQNELSDLAHGRKTLEEILAVRALGDTR